MIAVGTPSKNCGAAASVMRDLDSVASGALVETGHRALSISRAKIEDSLNRSFT